MNIEVNGSEILRITVDGSLVCVARVGSLNLERDGASTIWLEPVSDDDETTG